MLTTDFFDNLDRPAPAVRGPIPIADTWDNWVRVRAIFAGSGRDLKDLWTKENWAQDGVMRRTLRLAMGGLIYAPEVGFFEYEGNGETGRWLTQHKKNEDIAARWAARAMAVACEFEADDYDDTPELNSKGQPKANSSERDRFLDAMRPQVAMTNAVATLLRQMATDMGIVVRSEKFDADPHLFACASGVIDLRNGSVREPKMSDLLTKVSAVSYDPEMPTPHFTRFLESAHPDPEVRSFLQKVLGYSLTGEHREQRLFIHYGSTTANGKSVLMNTLSAIIGGHMGAASNKVIIKQRNGSAAIGQDVVDMAGFRMLVLNETDEGAHLDDAAVKSLTAADQRADRAHYEGNRQHRITGTLHLVTNHLPHITPDLAMRRRLTVIPWTQSFAANPDATLEDKLAAELPGILAWLVEGAQRWYAEGLAEPDLCAKALDVFFEEEDEVGAWLRSSTTATDPNSDSKTWAKVGDLYAHYRQWRLEQSMSGKEMSTTAFGRRLSALGFDVRVTTFEGKAARVRPLVLTSKQSLSNFWAAQ